MPATAIMPIRLTGRAGTWDLKEGEHVLGRDARCSMRVSDPRLSRQHARFVIRGDQLTVLDLGSVNGVLVNGDRVRSSRVLHQGDTVVCGPCLLVVELGPVAGPPEPVAARPDPPTGVSRARTEQMDAADVAVLTVTPGHFGSGPHSHPSRGIDPAIAGALQGSSAQASVRGGTEARERLAMEPSDVLPATSGGALSRHPTPLTQPSSTTSQKRPGALAPSEAPTHGTDALQPSRVSSVDYPSLAAALTGSLRAPRILAGVTETLMILVGLALVTLPVLAAGLALALHQAGAVVDGAGIHLPAAGPAGSGGPGPAGLGDLLAAVVALRSPSGLSDLLQALRILPDQQPFLIVFASGALAVLLGEVVLIAGLVVGTVRRGGPWCHRRFGLQVVDRRTGHHLGWTRATIRWILAGVLLPTGLITALLDWRSLADRCVGSDVRRR